MVVQPTDSLKNNRALLAVAAVTLVLAVSRVVALFDPDYWWHVETGRWIAAHRSVPTVDVFSHSFAGRPWLFVDWLADLLMFSLHAVGGPSLNTIVFALLGAMSVSIALKSAERTYLDSSGRHASPLAQLALAMVLACAIGFRISPRPQTLTFSILALLLAVLDGSESRPSRVRWAAPFLVLLWHNVHSSGQVGVAAVVAYAVGATVEKRLLKREVFAEKSLWIASVLSAVALFCTVRPVPRLLAAFGHVGDRRVAAILREWAPLSQQPLTQPSIVALGALFALACVAMVRLKQQRLGRVLACLGLAVLGTTAVRLVPYAALGCVALALSTLCNMEARKAIVGRGASVLLFVAASLGFYQQKQPLGLGVKRSWFSEGAARFVASHPMHGPMYNDFFDGGYLLSSLNGRYPVLIDGRAMAVYGIDFVARVYNQRPGQIVGIIRDFSCGFAVVHQDARVATVQAMPRWTVVYFDDNAFVAASDEQNSTLVAAYGYRELRFANRDESITQWQSDPARLARAQQESMRAIREAPLSSLAHMFAANVATAAHADGVAERESFRALELNPTSIPALRTRLRVCLHTEQRVCACTVARNILQQSAAQFDAISAIRQLRCE